MKLTLHNISTSLSFLPKLNKCIKAETNYNICILINKKKLYKLKERLKNGRDSWRHFIFRSGKTYKGTGDVFCLEEEEEDGVRSVVQNVYFPTEYDSYQYEPCTFIAKELLKVYIADISLLQDSLPRFHAIPKPTLRMRTW